MKWGTIKDIDKIPNTDQSTSNDIQIAAAVETTNSEVVLEVTKRTKKSSYQDDDYAF